MTKIEFEKRYAERSGLTVAELQELGVTIELCNCDDEICQGWQAVYNLGVKNESNSRNIRSGTNC